jgi:hypothetical protein
MLQQNIRMACFAGFAASGYYRPATRTLALYVSVAPASALHLPACRRVALPRLLLPVR